MLVDKRIEGQAVAPAGAEVLDVDARIPCCLALAPLEQRLLGALLIVPLGDAGNLEAEDDGPQ